MGGFVALKIVRAIATLWLVVTFVFVILRLSGDPTVLLLPLDLPTAMADVYRERWGIDRPFWEQYVTYMRSLLQGDFGVSFFDHRPAIDLVLERLPRTLQLGLVAYGGATVLALTLGVIAALHRDTLVDRLVMIAAVFGYSMPNFFFGLLLVMFFSLQLRWLPPSGSGTPEHLVMPAVALGLSAAAQIARFTRSSILEVLGQSYMRTARAKGASWGRRIRWHALPNAAIPLVTVLGFNFGLMIAGTIVIETVFAWPGMGHLFYQAVGVRDYAVVQAVLLVIAASVILVNLIVDLLYAALDPRIRLRGGDV